MGRNTVARSLIVAALCFGGCQEDAENLAFIVPDGGRAQDEGRPAIEDAGFFVRDVGLARSDAGASSRDVGASSGDAGGSRRDAGAGGGPSCSGPAQVRVYSPEGNERINGGTGLALLPGSVGVLVEGVVWVFDPKTDAPPTVLALDNIEGWPRHLESGPRGPVVVAERLSRDRPPEISGWVLGPGGWAQDTLPIPINGRLLDLALGAGRPFAAVLYESEAQLRVHASSGALVWSDALSSWRSIVRQFPDANLIFRRDESADSPLRAHPVDFGGVPFDPAAQVWEGPRCLRGGLFAGDNLDLFRDDDVLLLSTCVSEVRLERRNARTGAILNAVAWAGASAAPARIDRDAAGRFVVVTGTVDGPVLRLLDARTFAEVRGPEAIDSPVRWRGRQIGFLDVIADPAVSGRVTVAWSIVLGHGAGDIEVARADLCPSE